MQAITSSHFNLVEALQRGASLVVTEDGQWYERHWITSLFRRVVGWEESDKMSAAKSIVRYIQKLPYSMQTEQGQGLSSPDLPVNDILEAVRSSIHEMSERDFKVIERLKSEKNKASGETGKATLKKKIISILKHSKALSVERKIRRTELEYKNLARRQDEIDSTEINQEQRNWLEKKVQKWLSTQAIKLVYPEPQADIQKKIDRALQYPDFISAIQQDTVLRELFMKSVIRDGAQGSKDIVDLFIQAPIIQKLLRKTFLDKRLQAVANDGLKFIQNQETGKKEVSLLIHGKYQPITHGKNVVEVADGVHTTVDEVFKEFLQQNTRLIDMEYLQSGIEKYDYQLRDFDFNQERWWEKLPDIHVMSHEEVLKRFEVAELPDNAPLFVARASRKSRDMSAQDTHAWFDLYIPKENGTYNILSLGKYANFFPTGALETLRTVFSTERAVFTLCDLNKFMNYREHAEALLPPLTKEQFNITMEYIKNMFIAAREGRLHFQAQGDNCAAPVNNLIQKLYPDLKINPFQISFLDITVPQPLKLIRDARNLFPSDDSWNIFRKGISFLLGAFQKRSYTNEEGREAETTLMDYEPWQKGLLDLPARLFETRYDIQKKLTSELARE